MNLKKQRRVLILSLALSFFVIGCLWHHEPLSAQKSPVLKLGDPLPGNLFVELAKAVNPAVVNISTAQLRRQRIPTNPYRDPFYDFFEEFMGPDSNQGPKMAQALGTGFIIESDGLIITNNHVVTGADEIKVQLIGDKKLYDAELVGSDERSDIALIRMKGKSSLPVLMLGSSADAEVGEWVAAFGNPFGHTNSMTKGIISAKGRNIEEINSYPFIQTDASINPGNSGGPLVNSKGEVIGVNAAIDARAQGIGFAIPIDAVKELIPQLKKDGRVTRGYLGVMLMDLDFRYARELHLKDDKGALITHVENGSPADRAGIQPMDVIVKFGSRDIESAVDLSRAVLDTPVGKSTTVEIFRRGKKSTVTVSTMENSINAKTAKRPQAPRIPEGEDMPFDVGFNISKLSPSLAQKLGVAYIKSQPPVVTQVTSNSPSEKAGLRVGDIVLGVNNHRIKSVQEVKKALKSQVNILRVQRQGMVTLVYIEG